MQVKKQLLEQTWKNRLVQNWERSMTKQYVKAIYHLPAYFTSMFSTCKDELDELQAGIKVARRNINDLRYAPL